MRNHSDYQSYNNADTHVTRAAGRALAAYEQRIRNNQRTGKVLRAVIWYNIVVGAVAWTVRMAL